jgi:hypothetical protein
MPWRCQFHQISPTCDWWAHPSCFSTALHMGCSQGPPTRELVSVILNRIQLWSYLLCQLPHPLVHLVLQKVQVTKNDPWIHLFSTGPILFTSIRVGHSAKDALEGIIAIHGPQHQKEELFFALQFVCMYKLDRNDKYASHYIDGQGPPWCISKPQYA